MSSSESPDTVTIGEQYLHDFAPDFRVLAPETRLGDELNGIIRELADNGCVITLGVHRSQVERYTAMAGEQDILENCPDELLERCGNPQIMQNWLRRGRLVVGICATNNAAQVSVEDMATIGEDDVIPVAYGWVRPGDNKHIQGGGLTTAFRVSEAGKTLARAQRERNKSAFRLGLLLTRAVVALAGEVYGNEAGDISLVALESNAQANKMYEEVGFVQPDWFEPAWCERPTRQPIGTVINGHTVYYDSETGKNMVRDKHLLKVLASAALH